MDRNEKSGIISEIKELLESSPAVYLTDYHGINVEDISALRNQFRNEGGRYKVYKNTLVKRALQESGKYDKIADQLSGMIGFAFATKNPLAPAKIISKYFADKEKLSLKACYVEGEYFDGSQLKALATLPTKNELIAGIMGSLNSPVSGIVGAINAVMRDLVSVVEQIVQKNKQHNFLRIKKHQENKMSEKVTKALELIKGMSLMEAAELKKALEEKFGVTAAAPVMMAGAKPAAAAPPAEAAEEQTEFDVELTDMGPKKLNVIKVVRELTGLGLKEAKDLVEGVPKPVKEGVSKEEATTMKKKLEEAGGTVEIK